MRYFIFLLFSFSSLCAQRSISNGVVVQAVQLEPGSDETFAIYLPRGYDESKTYPTVFMFEASGDGAVAVQQFTIGAELTGSIIVAPNTAVNDTLAVGLKKSAAFINAIYERFAVDKSRIILAGNGKGALLASSSAHLTPDIWGVIAMDDAYVDLSLLGRTKKTQFVIMNADEGSNYYKLNTMGAFLRGKGVLAGFYIYEGKEEFPQSGYLASALTSLLLRSNIAQTQIQAFYDNDLAFGDLLFKQQKPLAAHSFVNGLKAKYKKHIDDLSLQKDLFKKIKNSKNYKVQRNQRSAVREAEVLLAEDFQYYLEEDVNNAYFDNLSWWNYQMGELDAKIDSTARYEQERKAAIRLKKYIQGATESKYQEIKKGSTKIAQLLFVNVLRTLVNPKNLDAFIQAISYSAQEGDANAALFYLEELLKMGYADYEALYEIEGTTALRISEEYNQIIKAYLGASKFY
ncbi:MAG: putative esterase [Flavobacteriales bacterium]|jgi:predicted esterase